MWDTQLPEPMNRYIMLICYKINMKEIYVLADITAMNEKMAIIESERQVHDATAGAGRIQYQSVIKL